MKFTILLMAMAQMSLLQAKTLDLYVGESIKRADIPSRTYVTCNSDVELPVCDISIGNGNFVLRYGGKNSSTKSRFIALARNVKELQVKRLCEGADILLSGRKILFPGQKMHVTRIEDEIKCVSKQQKDTKVCYIKEHPISAASLYFFESTQRSITLDSASSFTRDDYQFLEDRYLDLLEEIGLCVL